MVKTVKSLYHRKLTDLTIFKNSATKIAKQKIYTGFAAALDCKARRADDYGRNSMVETKVSVVSSRIFKCVKKL